MLLLDKIILFAMFKEFTPSAVEPVRFRYGCEYESRFLVRLRLINNNLVLRLMEADSFRYKG